MDPAAANPTSTTAQGGTDSTSLRSLSPQQWKSGIAAWLGWLFDGLDMHLFTMVAAPFVAALPLVDTPGVFLLMGLIGLTMEANFYPLALAAQNAVPRHVGFAAGVTLGVSIGIGAGISSLLGVLADLQGLRAAVIAIAVIEIVACGVALLVPRAVYDPE